VKTSAYYHDQSGVLSPNFILGTLSNDDDNDNNNFKKQLVLRAKQLLCTFLWRPLHDYDMKPPNAASLWRTWTYYVKFSLLYLNMDKALKNSTPGKVAYIWRIERFQIDAIKFEITQIHFFSDFSCFHCRCRHRRCRCLRSLLSIVIHWKTDTFPIDKEQYLDIITIAMNLFQVFITKFFNIFFNLLNFYPVSCYCFSLFSTPPNPFFAHYTKNR